MNVVKTKCLLLSSTAPLSLEFKEKKGKGEKKSKGNTTMICLVRESRCMQQSCHACNNVEGKPCSCLIFSFYTSDIKYIQTYAAKCEFPGVEHCCM